MKKIFSFDFFRIFKNTILIVSLYSITFSCNYLDVVPDNIPTIDHAFKNRNEAQDYLYGLLGGMPDVGNYAQDPSLAASDEVWVPDFAGGQYLQLKRILMGEQGPVSPWVDNWSSRQNGYNLNGGKPLWTTISDCNIFLENIHLPYDLSKSEQDKWRGEALFIKAYLHFWLFRQYGPIPLIKENLSVSTGTEEIMRHREPVDEVTDYIVELLDQAMSLLPHRLEYETVEMGRPTKCIAAALKAQVLALAASPLFNCNPDYVNYIDNRGVQLFPQDQSVANTKWKRAADAAKEAIEIAHEGYYRLYDAHTDFPATGTLSEETFLSIQVRAAATERWNDEIIWGNSRINNHSQLQRYCCPFFIATDYGSTGGFKSWGPTLRVVEQFYTKNGLPIEDDAEWEGRDRWALRTATEDDRQYIRQGRETVELFFDREARFYGSIMFDQGTLFGRGDFTADNTNSPSNLFVTELKYEQLNGYNVFERSTLTGFLCKKLLHHRTTATSSSYTSYIYAFPIIRLADLYLLYAETLNEWKDTPDGEVYEYIDLVRKRTGLKGVVESWNDHAIAAKKNLPASKEGMRDIIRRERLNELAFEGVPYWDIRRWKLAESYFHNRPIQGMNIYGTTAETFYIPTDLYTPKFEKKDYFSPIRTDILVTNTNLLQSPYW